MKIDFVSRPKEVDIEFLMDKLNQESPEYGSSYPFAFFIRDDNHQIIAGCNGVILFGSIYTDQLWVHPEFRKSGFGTKLMNQVHDYGRDQGCKIATVTTMSFQKAQGFYEKLGYTFEFERKGYANNSGHIFLKKNL